MKLKRLFTLMAFFSLIGIGKLWAQYTINDVPAGPDEFQWWVSQQEDPINYERTWLYYDADDDAVRNSMNAPWDNPVDKHIYKIQLEGDYTPEKGWELMRFNFGATRTYLGGPKNKQAINTPYFVLYNRYLSTMRVFMYLTQNFSASYNGYALEVTLESQNGSATPALFAPQDGQKGFLPIDDNFNSGSQYQDLNKFYVVNREPTAAGHWTVFEFPLGFDSRIEDFDGISMYFRFHFIQQYDIEADIDLVGTGYTDDIHDVNADDMHILFKDFIKPEEEFEKSLGQSVKEVLGKAAGFAQKVDAEDLAGKIHKGTEGFLKFLKKRRGDKDEKWLSKTVKKIHTATQAEKKTTWWKGLTNSFNSFFKSFVPDQTVQEAGKLTKAGKSIDNILGIVSGVAGPLSWAGDMLGLFGKAEANNDPVMATMTRTVTKGKLKGTMTIQLIGQDFRILVPKTFTPGPNNFFQPYFNCPLGLFGLSKAPRVQRDNYQRFCGYADATYIKTNRYSYYRDYSSIRFHPDDVTEGFGEIHINNSTEAELASYEYALVATVPNQVNDEFIADFLELNDEINPTPYVSSFKDDVWKESVNSSTYQNYINYKWRFENPLDEALNRGIYYVGDFQPTGNDNGDADIRTAFVKPHQLGDLTLNVPGSAQNIRLRVRALIKSALDDRAVYIERDFRLEEVEIMGRVRDGKDFELPPYHNYDVDPYLFAYLPDTYYATNFLNVNSASAFKTLNVTSYRGRSFTIGGGRQYTMNAGEEIIFSPEVHLVHGSDVTAGIPARHSIKIGEDVILDQRFNFASCNIDEPDYNPHNNQYFRMASFDDKPEGLSLNKILNAYPNPFRDELSLSFELESSGAVQIIVTDYTGKVITSYTKTLSEGMQTELVKLNGVTTGLYIVSVKSAEAVYTTRIFKQ